MKSTITCPHQRPNPSIEGKSIAAVGGSTPKEGEPETPSGTVAARVPGRDVGRRHVHAWTTGHLRLTTRARGVLALFSDDPVGGGSDDSLSSRSQRANAQHLRLAAARLERRHLRRRRDPLLRHPVARRASESGAPTAQRQLKLPSADQPRTEIERSAKLRIPTRHSRERTSPRTQIRGGNPQASNHRHHACARENGYWTPAKAGVTSLLPTESCTCLRD